MASRYEAWHDGHETRVDYEHGGARHGSHDSQYYQITQYPERREGCCSSCSNRTCGLFQARGSSPLESLTLGEWWANKSSLFTIVTIYSIMNGATMHVMPGLFLRAGILVAVALTGVVGLVCWYTCRLIFKIGAHDSRFDDFSDCVKFEFVESSGMEVVGEIGRYVALLTSMVMVLVVCLTYHFIIMSYIMLMWPASASDCSDPQELCVRVVVLACSALLLLLMAHLRMVILMQLSMVGAVCFVGGMVAVIVENAMELANKAVPYSSFHEILYYGDSVNQLCGVLFVSFFIHNVILPIIKCQTNMETAPELRERDVGIGYVCVGLTYILVGTLGALALQVQPPTEGESTMLRAHSKLVYALSVAHASTFYPLLAVVFRQQVEKALMRREGSRSSRRGAGCCNTGWGYVLTFVVNAAVVGFTSVVTYFLLVDINNIDDETGEPNEAELVRRISVQFEWLTDEALSWAGACAGIIYALILPLVVSLIIVKRATGRLSLPYCVGYALLLATGTACVVLQFLPSFPESVPWIHKIPPTPVALRR